MNIVSPVWIDCNHCMLRILYFADGEVAVQTQAKSRVATWVDWSPVVRGC